MNFYKTIKELNLQYQFNFVHIALEREGLRIKNNMLSDTPHPTSLEPKELHNYITTDFSESQLEFITPYFPEVEKAYNFLDLLYDIAIKEMDDTEFIWPYSMPCKINSDSEVKLANYSYSNSDKGMDFTKYREYLSKKYSNKKQLISGIHFNFSLPDKLIDDLNTDNEDLKSFKNKLYMKIINNYERYKFLVILFLGATPYDDNMKDPMISIRSSKDGYKNSRIIPLDYSSFENYIDSVNLACDSKEIYDSRELYTCSRIKNGHKPMMETIMETGIQYVEIRNIDLNPYEKVGISLEDMNFIKNILLFCLFTDEEAIYFEKEDYITASLPHENTFIRELNMTLKDYSLLTLKKMHKLFDELQIHNNIANYIDKLNTGDLLFKKVAKDIETKGYSLFNAHLFEKYKNSVDEYSIKGYTLELSTVVLINDAIRRNLFVKIIDEKSNFISISNKIKREYIKNANMTSLDNYSSVLAVENKSVTKYILDENNISVPTGKSFTNKELALKYAKTLNSFVVKPVNSNFGNGISIFKEGYNNSVVKAIEFAFTFDNSIIIEEFIDGTEYRFLVINHKVEAILERVPANVTGNGTSTIAELIDIKNSDAIRGVNHEKPYEKIICDEIVTDYLKSSNLTLDSIPTYNEIVFLRKNTNISTGGDGIDHTDTMPEIFIKTAEEATKKLNIKICGVDMMIKNKNKKDYAILEMNFNPAIYIHNYPSVGLNRDIGNKILDALGF
ncbi:MAG: bifunctional glutamate--cysteine ligase GshA/glutathione synthetase GshB [Lachnospirales bacterium]